MIERLDPYPGSRRYGVGIDCQKSLLLQQRQSGLLYPGHRLLTALLPGLAPHTEIGGQWRF